MISYLIDTNILIDFLRGKKEAIAFMAGLSIQPIISSLTVAELFAGVKGKREKIAIHNLVHACEVISVDEDIAEEGGLLKNKYQKCHQLGLADALIGATALSSKLTLVSLNKKQFPMLKNVHIPY